MKRLFNEHGIANEHYYMLKNEIMAAIRGKLRKHTDYDESDVSLCAKLAVDTAVREAFVDAAEKAGVAP